MRAARLFAAVLLGASCITAAEPPFVDLGKLKIHVLSDTIIRVTCTPVDGPLPAKPGLVVKADWPAVDYGVKFSGDIVTVNTSAIRAVANTTSLSVSFYDAVTGNLVLQEHPTSPRTFTPITDVGRATYKVEQRWVSPADEALYGGGESQNGLLNWKNAPIELVQFNTEAIVPFFVSTKGYGLLWDNYAWSYLNRANQRVNLQPVTAEQLPPLMDGTQVALLDCPSAYSWVYNTTDNRIYVAQNRKFCLDCDGCTNNHPPHIWSVDATYINNQVWKVQADGSVRSSTNPTVCLTAEKKSANTGVTMQTCASPLADLQKWQLGPDGQLHLSSANFCAGAAFNSYSGQFTATVDGTYHFFSEFEHGFGAGFGKTYRLVVGNNVVAEWLGDTNLPNSLTGRVVLQKGTYNVTVYSAGFADPINVYVQSPDFGLTTLASDVADFVDYYFVYGRTIDGSIALYRTATGAAPLFAKWIFGFWQCREHYASQPELLAAAQGYRNRSLPVDNIVQDWQYWGDLGWGPHWDPRNYPDPAGMVKELDAMHFKLMVSVWSKFDENTTFYQKLLAQNQLIPQTNWFDPYNPGAREQFYAFSKASMFDIGVDALWLDATEPEYFPHIDKQLYLGTGNALMNPYSLMVTSAIANGLAQDQPNKRVFSLTRSSFAGQQRTGGVLWSGDISGTWASFRRQVTASLNFQLSGMPYWSEDIGGFFRPNDQYDSPDYHNLLTRWFQFGSFTPIFRVHGAGSHTEYWNYGPDVERRVLAVDNLRYRLLPYIYSLAWKVETTGYTIMRALVFDFSDDSAVLNIPDEYTWGPAFLVAPVLENTTTRSVYFPRASWVDFWSGKPQSGGVSAQVDAPLDIIPLFVRAGSIVPLGPFLQYTSEKPADPIELRVYTGNDASFELYEDDGATKAYTTGQFAVIRFEWDEKRQQLTISDRQGSFPGMLETRTIQVVFVAPGHGAGLQPEANPDSVVQYTGKAVVINKK